MEEKLFSSKKQLQGTLEVLGGVDCFSGFCSKQTQA